MPAGDLGNNLIGLGVSYVYVFAILLTGKAFMRFGVEASRKFVHIMVCNWWLLAMVFFRSPIWAAIPPASFVVLNWLSYRYGLFDAMERKEGKGDLGTVYYAISLLVLTLLTFGDASLRFAGGAGILAMGYGDGLAALIGSKTRWKPFRIFGATRSLSGSLSMWNGFQRVVCLLLLFHDAGSAWWIALLAATFATIVEVATPLGLDNFSVPLLTAGLVWMLMPVK